MNSVHLSMSKNLKLITEFIAVNNEDVSVRETDTVLTRQNIYIRVSLNNGEPYSGPLLLFIHYANHKNRFVQVCRQHKEKSPLNSCHVFSARRLQFEKNGDTYKDVTTVEGNYSTFFTCYVVKIDPDQYNNNIIGLRFLCSSKERKNFGTFDSRKLWTMTFQPLQENIEPSIKLFEVH